MAAPTDFNPVINEGIYIQRKTGTENHELTYEITREIFECDVDDILVQVEACGVNFQDVLLKHGFDKFEREKKGVTKIAMGTECAGKVIDCHSSLKDQWIGRRVLLLLECGAWRRFVCVNVASAIKIPDRDMCGRPIELSCPDAVAIGLHHIFALRILREADLPPSPNVLIFNAGGAMGIALSQLCKNVYGATVYGIASKWKFKYLNPSKPEEDPVVDHLFRYETDYVESIRRKIKCQRPIDVVLDGLSGPYARKSLNLLKDKGIYVCYGQSSAFRVQVNDTEPFHRVEFDTRHLWWKKHESFNKIIRRQITIRYTNLRVDLKSDGIASYMDCNETFWNLVKLREEKNIGPFVHFCCSLQEAQDSLLTMERRWNIGKIILTLNLQKIPVDHYVLQPTGIYCTKILGANEPRLRARAIALKYVEDETLQPIITYCPKYFRPKSLPEVQDFQIYAHEPPVRPKSKTPESPLRPAITPSFGEERMFWLSKEGTSKPTSLPQEDSDDDVNEETFEQIRETVILNKCMLRSCYGVPPDAKKKRDSTSSLDSTESLTSSGTTTVGQDNQGLKFPLSQEDSGQGITLTPSQDDSGSLQSPPTPQEDPEPESQK